MKKNERGLTLTPNFGVTPRSGRGFTLIELLVVIAIIGVLATLATAAFNYAKNRAKTTKAQHDEDQILKAISMLANDSGFWPGHQEVNKTATQAGYTNNNEICGDGCAYGLSGASAGIAATDGNYTNWGGPYFVSLPLDPWGREYFFDTDYQVTSGGQPCNGAGGCIEAVVIGSYGPDGVGSNQYNADDIIKIILK